MHTINLNQSAEKRMKTFLEEEYYNLAAVTAGARGHIPWWLQGLAGVVTPYTRAWSGGLYQDEISVIADTLEERRSGVELLQYSYEINHFAEVVGGQHIAPIGCTVGIKNSTHLRTMDWDIPVIQRASRLVKYTKGRHSFIGVTIPGFVGLLTGMVPGQYSLSLNYATANARPSRNIGAAFLLRDVLETCKTFDQAFTKIASTPIASPAFFALCGGRAPEQAVIIEAQPDPSDTKVRWMGDGYVDRLVQTNHYHYITRAEDPEMVEDSKARYNAMWRGLGEEKVNTGHLMSLAPIYNETTQQRVIMDVANGNIVLM